MITMKDAVKLGLGIAFGQFVLQVAGLLLTLAGAALLGK